MSHVAQRRLFKCNSLVFQPMKVTLEGYLDPMLYIIELQGIFFSRARSHSSPDCSESNYVDKTCLILKRSTCLLLSAMIKGVNRYTKFSVGSFKLAEVSCYELTPLSKAWSFYMCMYVCGVFHMNLIVFR